MTTKRTALVNFLTLEDDGPHLISQRCAACGAITFGNWPACNRCGGGDLAPHEVAQTGELRSFAVVHRGPPGVPTPFVSAVVALDGGGFLKGNLIGVEPDPAAIMTGIRVRLTTIAAGQDAEHGEIVAPAFEPMPEWQEGINDDA